MAVSRVEVVVLGCLAEEPLYGYDLLERFRTRSMGFWVEVGKASVYQALRRLEREGRSTGGRRTGPRAPTAACTASPGRAAIGWRKGSRSGSRRWSRTRRTAGLALGSSTCFPPPAHAGPSTNARARCGTCWMR